MAGAILCPYCDAENIEGADECAECGEALWDLSVRVPASSVESDLLRDRIERLWPKSPSTVTPNTPVGQVLKKMVDERIGCVMIVDGGKLAGIFSERDALMKLNTDAARFMERPISQFMTPDPVTLETNDKIAFALHKMNVGGYRHIPILFGGKLAGVISIRDILRYLTERIAAAAARR
ncbi:MAG TPA: CBS domain-containing protein [Lacipirellulaceae bacterium]|jgi:CBS domain-containing protein|nr:CBS domain-containing protein [Lacipirellulaceae bacterium]